MHRGPLGAQLLRAWREGAKLTQAELAQRARVNPSVICRLEQGRKVVHSRIIRETIAVLSDDAVPVSSWDSPGVNMYDAIAEAAARAGAA